ncbi:hypothetical protein GCM10010246_06940 [Streptomyces cuspidosporus]|uniref:Secreted protein n=1 Tax=Streptomyces cuspidosporus TaxID=66882 RepID=A0ABP5SCK9_9ACTN
MVCAGLLLVFAARSPTTAGSTVTAPGGAFAGPAAGSAHTRATDLAGAPDVADAPVGSAGASDALVQPVTASRTSTSGAAGHARCPLPITTRPS